MMFELLVIVYNKCLIFENEVLKICVDLIKLFIMQVDKFKGKVMIYDIEKLGVGFNYLMQDVYVNEKVMWEFVKVIGVIGLKLQLSMGVMMECILLGENLIGYNIIGLYVYVKVKKDKLIGYVFLKDYMQVVSCFVMVLKKVKNLNVVKLWVDYLLLKCGQMLIVNQVNLYVICMDVSGEMLVVSFMKEFGDLLKLIQIGIGLFVYFDQLKCFVFLK